MTKTLTVIALFSCSLEVSLTHPTLNTVLVGSYFRWFGEAGSRWIHVLV